VIVGLLVLLGILAVLLLWGAVAPRSEWRILLSWVYRRPKAHEPGERAYRRWQMVGIVGIIPVIMIGLALYPLRHPTVEAVPIPTYGAGQAKAGHVWSSATGAVSLNTSTPVEDHGPPPSGAQLVPLVGYAPVDPASRQPDYLYALFSVTGPGASNDPNTYLLLGSDSGCEPDELVVTESADEIRVGLYEVPFSGGSVQDCLHRDPGNHAPAVSLYPVDHASAATPGAPVGKRRVIDMATGRPLRRIG
jgi:hypothetical protein